LRPRRRASFEDSLPLLHHLRDQVLSDNRKPQHQDKRVLFQSPRTALSQKVPNRVLQLRKLHHRRSRVNQENLSQMHRRTDTQVQTHESGRLEMKKPPSHQQNEFQQTSRELKRPPHWRQPYQQTPELTHIPVAMIHPAPKETA
jgi:hypothetical protein